MPKKRKKKVNPHRIPLAKSAVDKDAILSEATQDDMYRAWLLVVNAIIEQGQIPVKEIPALADTVNKYISSAAFQGKVKEGELRRAEKLMGLSNAHMNLNPDMIRSPIELIRFKEKVFKVATSTSLSVICLGLEATGRFHKENLRQLFFNVDLTLAEIDNGINSFEKIEKSLTDIMVRIEVDEGEYSTVKIEI